MESKAKFQSLPEELQAYILSFLPYRDILRCQSLCKALHQTYISSSELQYVVELGGQQLLPVPETDPDNHISIFQRLQLLRDRAYAWFKLDIRSLNFATITIPEQFHHAYMRTSARRVANGHLCLWNNREDSATVFPILPKASQRTIKRDWSPSSLRSNPNARISDMFMDPAQNLITVAYANTVDPFQSGDRNFYVDIGALDGGGSHPQAAGQTFFLLELRLPGYENGLIEIDAYYFKLKGLGRHIAFWRALSIGDATSTHVRDLWELQIWDWQHSTICKSVLTDRLERDEVTDFCFLGHDKLVIFSCNLELYSIEDMSQAPQLLACFMMAVPVMSIWGAECNLPMDDSTQPLMQAQQMMWISDPKQQLLILSLDSSRATFVFIISTRIFFDPGFSEGLATEIPWTDWGPSNSRAFRKPFQYRLGVSGNRVLTMEEDGSPHAPEFRFHVMDFSPLAVERRQGLGRAVKEPSTIEITDSLESPNSMEKMTLTTNLPYVEVVLDRTFSDPFDRMWIDMDKIYLYAVCAPHCFHHV
ncbi:hypothetical protein EDB19DRAFT_1274362 [Suillus lakei]|nr:hypothetical protein EDB19DRAFT_1274362 [Suillus lakei]